jgi:hypothetical protein
MSKVISLLLGLFIVLPIWLVMLYQIMQASHVADWVWVLYWVYVPVCVLAAIVTKLAELVIVTKLAELVED